MGGFPESFFLEFELSFDDQQKAAIAHRGSPLLLKGAAFQRDSVQTPLKKVRHRFSFRARGA
jgi:hypothetical protein